MPTKAVLASLTDRHLTSIEPPVTSTRTYFDTHDGRLSAAGMSLESDRHAVGATVTVRARDNEQVLARSAMTGELRAAADLPSGPQWDRLRMVLERRRLLPIVELRTTTRAVRILDATSKTTVRVLIEHHVFMNEGVRTAGVFRHVALAPVRGYGPALADVAGHLHDAMGLMPVDGPLLHVALALTGQPGPDTGARPGAGADPNVAADEAVAVLLGRLFAEFVDAEPGVRQQLDVEFLHDFRVAARRARSVLKQVRDAAPAAALEALPTQLAWLGRVTGHARDLDVYLEMLDEPDAVSIAGFGSDDLDPLRAFLRGRRDAEQARLVAALDSVQYRLLVDTWRMAGEPRNTPAAAGEVLTVGELADRCIARAHRRIVKPGAAINTASPAESLHDLRKRGKELRYVLEAFGDLYPAKPRGSLLRELRLLQGNLGEFQDCQVQALALHKMADELLARLDVPAATFMTMGLLAAHLEQRQAQARTEFAARFAAFAAPRNLRLVKDMLGARRAVGTGV